MNKWLTLAAATLMSFSAVAAEKVVLYNWADYIPDTVLKQFTKETGIEVEVATFDSNESMFAKLQLLKGKGYDLTIPTTFFIERMKRADLIQPIDKSKLTNFGNLEPNLLNQSYDPNNQYSVPYLWGSTAITVNTDEIDPKTITKWADLWKPEYKGQILLLDDVRDIFLMALKVKGFENNTRNEDEIRQAYELLVDLLPNVKLFLSDSPKGPLIQGNVPMGVMWNGEAYMAQVEMDTVAYIYPEEGATLWVDSFVIPKGAANVEGAHKFIDFVLRPEIGKIIIEEIGYSTPNKATVPLLSEELRNNPMVVPPAEVLEKGSFHNDLGDANAIYEKYWQMLKQKQS
ncbi:MULTISPECIES: extracellular solute-binding protein [unclassified Motilimonas]|uniref:extracellular solute-binding protein n=1 Tax=unclassified Motilimonas TaxID=2643697 RepID=UPI001E2B98BE|nr:MULTISPECIES: extracellular solute-binding protein [unclassified Motilimonas]MCE0558976.1 extracellular solute-binding protein [Motilimonas sp. E26]MDO6527383.1 extracellular solute-binding protein [Motilimonas sp. 1_MG-2023]